MNLKKYLSLMWTFPPLVVGLASATEAETFTVPRGSLPGIIHHSQLILEDDVSDRCWTNAETISSKVRLLFEQNEISVLAEAPAYYSGSIVMTTMSALGFRAENGLCAVSAYFSVNSVVSQTLGGENDINEYHVTYLSEIFRKSSIFVASRNSDQQLADFFEGHSSEFVANVVSSRRDPIVARFMSDFPQLASAPMTRATYLKILESGK